MTPTETFFIVSLMILAVTIGYLITRIGSLCDEVEHYKNSREYYKDGFDRRGRTIDQLNDERADFESTTEKNFISTLSIGDEFTPIGDGPTSRNGSHLWTDNFKGSKNTIIEIDYDNRKFVSVVEGNGTFDVNFDEVKDMLWLKTDSSKKIKFKFV